MVWNSATISQASKTDARLMTHVTQARACIEEWNDDPKQSDAFLDYQCHSICIALASIIPGLTVVHGCYCGLKQKWHKGKFVDLAWTAKDHSWLTTPNGNIIDPHPVGIIATEPLLVIGRGKNVAFGAGLYFKGHIQKRKYCNKKVAQQVKVLITFLESRRAK